MSRSVGVNTLSDEYCKAHTPKTSPLMYFPQYMNPTWFPSLFDHEQNNDFTGRIILPYGVYGPSYAYESYEYESYESYEYENYDDTGSSRFLIHFF